ncbi:hypothetical protein D9M69_432590 [compost metagenome]
MHMRPQTLAQLSTAGGRPVNPCDLLAKHAKLALDSLDVLSHQLTAELVEYVQLAMAEPDSLEVC